MYEIYSSTIKKAKKGQRRKAWNSPTLLLLHASHIKSLDLLELLEHPPAASANDGGNSRKFGEKPEKKSFLFEKNKSE